MEISSKNGISRIGELVAAMNSSKKAYSKRIYVSIFAIFVSSSFFR